MPAGTPGYMAPEYFRGESRTEAVDVFALATIAAYAATAWPAFGGTGHSVLYRILEQAPDLDGCPEPVRTVAAHCLAKDPAEQPGLAEVIRLCRTDGPDSDALNSLVFSPDGTQVATTSRDGIVYLRKTPASGVLTGSAPAGPGIFRLRGSSPQSRVAAAHANRVEAEQGGGRAGRVPVRGSGPLARLPVLARNAGQSG
ncbi:hypothetical protein [Streptomyces sp. NPDC001948]